MTIARANAVLDTEKGRMERIYPEIQIDIRT